MRDCNVPVWTRRLLRYEQIVNSTFKRMGYVWGYAMSGQVETAKLKKNDQCDRNLGFFENWFDFFNLKYAIFVSTIGKKKIVISSSECHFAQVRIIVALLIITSPSSFPNPLLSFPFQYPRILWQGA
jgi:hypothetical protein